MFIVSLPSQHLIIPAARNPLLQKGDKTIIRIYELLSIARHVIDNNTSSGAIPISTFSSLLYLLQSVANNMHSLSPDYMSLGEFQKVKQVMLAQGQVSWLRLDRLTVAHTLNIQKTYKENNQEIAKIAHETFFESGFFDAVEEYCDNIIGQKIASPEIVGNIHDLTPPIHNMLHFSKLALPHQHYKSEHQVSIKELKHAIYYHAELLNITFQDCRRQGPDQELKSFEFQAFAAYLIQIIGNDLKLLRKYCTSAEDFDVLNSDSVNALILTRNYLAHEKKGGITLISVKTLKFLLQGYQDTCLKLHIDVNAIGQQLMIDIAEATKAPVMVMKEESNEVELADEKQQLVQVEADEKDDEDIDQIVQEVEREGLIGYMPSKEMLAEKSYAISKQIVEIIIRVYNDRTASMTAGEVARVTELVNDPLFNPYTYVKCNTLTAKQFHVIESKNNKILKIYEKSAKHYNHQLRPIDVLLELGEPFDLIKQIIQKEGLNFIADNAASLLYNAIATVSDIKFLQLIIDNLSAEQLSKFLNEPKAMYAMGMDGKVHIKVSPLVEIAVGWNKEDHAILLVQNGARVEGIVCRHPLANQPIAAIEQDILCEAMGRKAFKFVDYLIGRGFSVKSLYKYDTSHHVHFGLVDAGHKFDDNELVQIFSILEKHQKLDCNRVFIEAGQAEIAMTLPTLCFANERYKAVNFLFSCNSLYTNINEANLQLIGSVFKRELFKVINTVLEHAPFDLSPVMLSLFERQKIPKKTLLENLPNNPTFAGMGLLILMDREPLTPLEYCGVIQHFDRIQNAKCKASFSSKIEGSIGSIISTSLLLKSYETIDSCVKKGWISLPQVLAFDAVKTINKDKLIAKLDLNSAKIVSNFELNLLFTFKLNAIEIQKLYDYRIKVSDLETKVKLLTFLNDTLQVTQSSDDITVARLQLMSQTIEEALALMKGGIHASLPQDALSTASQIQDPKTDILGDSKEDIT